MDDELRQQFERLEAEIEALKSERIPTVDRASKRRDKRQVFAGFGLFAVAVMIAGTMSASALSGTNTVDSGDIKDGTIISSDIKSDAILGSRVRDNTLTGADVNESTFVPTCPTGFSLAADVCYGQERGAALFSSALDYCTDHQFRLPSLSEADLVASAAQSAQYLWVDDAGYFESSGAVHKLISANGTTYLVSVSSATSAYRCVTTVGGRP